MSSHESRITTHHLKVHRTARYYVVGQPNNATRDLWVACHGYGQLAESFAHALEPLSGEGRVVVAPEALSRFYLAEPLRPSTPDTPIGAAWMTRADRLSEIADYVAYLDALVEAMRAELPRDVRVSALGFSQGVATVCRWAALGRTRLARLVFWAGKIADDLPADRGDRVFHGASIVMVGGKTDSLLTPKVVLGERRKLEALGLSVEFLDFDGGHSLNSELLGRLARQ